MVNEIVTYRGKPISSAHLNKEQREAVAYFFARLKTVDPGEFDRLMPDERTEAMLKREYATYLIELTKEQIDRGFGEWHAYRQKGDPDYRFLNIDRVIGLIRTGMQSPKYFFPQGYLPEPEYQKQKRKDEGTKKIKKILSIFDED